MPDDPLGRLLADPPALPVAAVLDDVVRAAGERGAAVVVAPPGTGKTTLVPPALAAAVRGRVVVTQPRRIAARAAAARLAHLLGEPVGRTVGYSVRGERRVGGSTRIEMVTTGVLLRRLQRDPELPGTDVVVLDEVHERHLDADLTLALLVDVRANLRDDVQLVAMSATLQAERTAAVLGGDVAAPVVSVPGALHPVDPVWCPAPRGVTPLDERGVTPAFLDHVADCTRRALTEREGDVLVFVPGAGEVGALVRRLAGAPADIRPLHGRLSHRDQDLALAAGPRRRVVVATAVAESSLTVPGVRVVVDAGLAREPRTDHRRGLAGLVTVRVSRSGAVQRAGRAGREAPGAVYRCWSEADHARLSPHAQPEIATADLTAFALELACWGSPQGSDLALLEAPPAAAMAAAGATLRGLGAVDRAGAVTARGRLIAGIGADPRLARALVDGAPLVGRRRAAEVVAMLDADVRDATGDLVAALRGLRRGDTEGSRDWARSTARLLDALPGGASAGSVGPGARDRAHDSARVQADDMAGDETGDVTDDLTVGLTGDVPDDLAVGLTDDLAVGVVVALAHPDRIARLRPGGTSYLMTSGTGASFGRGGTSLAGLPWLAVADADRGAGRSDATIRSAAPLDESLARAAASGLLREQRTVTWVDGRVEARRTTSLGAIELAAVAIPRPEPHLVVAAVRDGLARDGLAVLPWSPSAVALRRRLDLLHRTLGAPWPDVGDDALLDGLDAWLGPDLVRIRRSGDLARVDVVAALRRLLPWPEAARLDELVPERVTVPSGSSVRVDYEPDQPVLAVRLQEVLGWRRAPRIADGRVPLLLHLLSPAGRPAAVTADLGSFWTTGYPQVRAELRGRYPKHDWPADPLTATPTRGARRPGGAPRP